MVKFTFFYVFLRFLILRWRHSGEMLEVFAEGGLVSEVECISHLLDVLAGKLDEVLGFEHHKFVDPIGGRAARSVPDNH